MEATEQRLRALIEDLAFLEPDELKPDTELLEEVLDSEGLVEVGLFVEAEIGRPLADEERVPGTFETPSTILRFIVTNRKA